MDNDTERLLQANGWEVECYSPLEVRHSESGSFASGLAASHVVDALRQTAATPPSSATLLQELLELIEEPVRVAQAAAAQGTSQAWETAYGMVFPGPRNERMQELLKQLGLRLDYYDPDTSHEEDVLAYVNALQSLRRRIEPFLQALQPSA